MNRCIDSCFFLLCKKGIKKKIDEIEVVLFEIYTLFIRNQCFFMYERN